LTPAGGNGPGSGWGASRFREPTDDFEERFYPYCTIGDYPFCRSGRDSRISGWRDSCPGPGPKIPKQLTKQINKEGRKLSGKAEQAGNRVGQNAIFCLLAAHTDLGTGPELKALFEAAEDDLTFGDFVAAVVMAEITDIPLDEILDKLIDGPSLGEIAKEAGLDVDEMGDIHRGFADFRGEVIQTMTHPPATDCFEVTPWVRLS
jgi:hypothetical protein